MIDYYGNGWSRIKSNWFAFREIDEANSPLSSLSPSFLTSSLHLLSSLPHPADLIDSFEFEIWRQASRESNFAYCFNRKNRQTGGNAAIDFQSKNKNENDNNK